MKRTMTALVIGALLLAAGCQCPCKSASRGWISLFDGKTLDGWKAGQNKDTFSVCDGQLIVRGDCCHLFYDSPVENADFTNFEFKADILTKPGANSGVYFHTQYKDVCWPDAGYEVQVNNSHSDWRRTGGLYAIADVKDAPAQDNEWFTLHIIVIDKHIVVKVNDTIVTDYTEPDGVSETGYPGMPARKLAHGTFAIQGHDPASEVHYKNIRVKPLP